MVPLAGIEPALLAELDFESSASTSSATGAFAVRRPQRKRGGEAGGTIAAGLRGSTRADVISRGLDRHKVAGYETLHQPDRRDDRFEHADDNRCPHRAPGA